MIQKNPDHAEELIQQAVDDGAELILLPELLPSGRLHILSYKRR